ncbi:MAG: rod-binding protein [Hydrogenophilales bacterium]|nr:rod-binding protein [Hydrogenophilales bacterium]
MISSLDTASFALGNEPLGDLKLALKRDAAQGTPGQSIHAVAKQFEGMFLNILMRGMRSGGGNSLLDNNETKLYTELLDQQFAQKIADGRGLGLADALVKQIARSQAHTLPSPDAPAQPLTLKKEETAKAFTQGLPGAAPTPLPLHRSEPPGAFTLPANASAPRYKAKS